MARESYNPDAIYVGDFKGLATAGGSFGADPSYLQTLTNAFVTKDGRLKQRSGSNFLYGLSTTALPEFFQFTFAGERFIIHRTGVSFSVYRVALDAQGQPFNVHVLSIKTNVFRTESANEPASYAVKSEGNYCHVLIATASTTLIDCVLTYRDTIVTSVSATTTTSTIGQYFGQNNLSQNNSKVFTPTDVSPTTAIANVGNQLTLTWVSRPPEFVVGYKLRLFSCFWLRAVDASYYQGSQLYNTGLRRNTGTGALISSGQYRSGERVTATEVNSVKDAGGNKLTDVYEHVETSFVVPLLECALELVRKHCRKSVVKIASERPGIYDYFQLLPEDFSHSYSVFLSASQSIINRDRNIRRLQEFMALVAGVPQFAEFVDYSNLYDDLLRKFGFDDPERYRKQQEPEQAPAPASATEALSQGMQEIAGEPGANAVAGLAAAGQLPQLMSSAGQASPGAPTAEIPPDVQQMQQLALNQPLP